MGCRTKAQKYSPLGQRLNESVLPNASEAEVSGFESRAKCKFLNACKGR